MDILDLVGVCGQQNIPGVETQVFAVCECDIDVFPAPVSTSTLGSALTVTSNIVLKPLKKFAEFTIQTESGEVKDTLTGPRGSKSFVSTLDFNTVNVGAPVADWFNRFANGCAILIVREKNGAMRILGKPGSPAMLESAEGTSGINSESERIWKSQFKAAMGTPAYYYTGTVDLDPLT